MFIGREQELAQLMDAIGAERSATLIYGKRRVGKTTLIKQALAQSDKPCVYYECLKGTLDDNIAGLAKAMQDAGLLRFSTMFSSFQDVFAYLSSLGKPVVIVIDEYSYLKSMADAAMVDSIFQSIIDNHLANINLVVSGSHVGIMKEMLEENNALYGRFNTVIHLREFSYRDAAAFYLSKSSYDKPGFYAVFGGSPYILKELNDRASLKENIIKTVLNESSPVQLYAANLLLSEYSNSVNAERILAVLGNGKKRYTELESKLNTNKTGNLAKQLKTLTTLEIVKKTAPINKLHDAKKVGYEVNDNLMRFYFTYVYRNRSALQMLGAETFYEQYIAPTLTEYISRRFEELCRDFFSFLAKQGKLPGISNIGTYYYDDPATKTNGEFDVALEFGKEYTIVEAKYYKGKLTRDEINREIGQVRKITELSVAGIGFVSVGGFENPDLPYLYYTGDDMFA